MTEGSTEKAFIDLLLEKNMLVFKKNELLMEQVFHSRQIKGELIGYIQMIENEDTISIYRIGDKLSDKLKIPQSILSTKIKDKNDVCTLPEFEILFILNEGLLDEYMKNKSNKKPSDFYKEKNNNYNKQSSFITEYFEKMSNQEIHNLLELYANKRGSIHNKNQKKLLDIIK